MAAQISDPETAGCISGSSLAKEGSAHENEPGEAGLLSHSISRAVMSVVPPAAAGATYAQPRSRSREPRSQYAADRRPARWLGISRPRGARLLRGKDSVLASPAHPAVSMVWGRRQPPAAPPRGVYRLQDHRRRCAAQGGAHCHHAAWLNVGSYADAATLPSFGPRMVCTACGIIGAEARPNWREQAERPSLTGA